MTVFTTRLTGSEQLAEGTRAFYLERPASFDYKPGQAVDLLLVETTEGQTPQSVESYLLWSAPPRATADPGHAHA